MKQAVHAEWTKLRTVAGPAWLLAAAVVLTVGLGALVVASMTYSPGDGAQDTTRLSLTGLEIGQAVVAILAVLLISSEYSTGMIRITLVAVPRRSAVLLSKGTLLTSVTLVAAAISVAGSLLVGRVILLSHGFTAAHGYMVVSLAHGPTLRAAVGSVMYLALIALFGLGIGMAIRDSATAIGVVLALLYLFPLVASFIGNPQWHRHLEQIGPMTAGLAIQSTIDLRGMPLTPWSGLGVMAAWAAGALLLGGLLLRLRDA
jgi:ABC-2 type transport system permease protein